MPGPSDVPDFDLYAELEVRSDPSSDVIAAAYRAIAKTKHPDIGNESNRMQRVNVAYTWLRDPELRARYDAAQMLNGRSSGTARRANASARPRARGTSRATASRPKSEASEAWPRADVPKPTTFTLPPLTGVEARPGYKFAPTRTEIAALAVIGDAAEQQRDPVRDRANAALVVAGAYRTWKDLLASATRDVAMAADRMAKAERAEAAKTAAQTGVPRHVDVRARAAEIAGGRSWRIAPRVIADAELAHAARPYITPEQYAVLAGPWVAFEEWCRAQWRWTEYSGRTHETLRRAREAGHARWKKAGWEPAEEDGFPRGGDYPAAALWIAILLAIPTIFLSLPLLPLVGKEPYRQRVAYRPV